MKEKMKASEIHTMEIQYRKDWPPEEFYIKEDTDIKIIRKFIKLIDSNSNERTIDDFITRYPSLIARIMFEYHTGHHASWVVPKKYIKTKIYPNDKGQIPDFLIAGLSSNGIEWFVVELKGVSTKVFSESSGKRYFSSEMNKGLNQLLDYLNICDEDQAYLRDRHQLRKFKNPKGILIIGRRDEFENNEALEKLKKSWNDHLNRINIRTYDWFKKILLDQIKYRLQPTQSNSALLKKLAQPTEFKEPQKSISLKTRK